MFLWTFCLTEDLEDAIKEVEKFNPHGSFPTLVINDGTHVIIGFKEHEIREALG